MAYHVDRTVDADDIVDLDPGESSDGDELDEHATAESIDEIYFGEGGSSDAEAPSTWTSVSRIDHTTGDSKMRRLSHTCTVPHTGHGQLTCPTARPSRSVYREDPRR